MIPKFIQTKDDIIWFAFNNVKNGYLCFPKKVGNYKGKRYAEWYEKPIDILQKYEKYISGLDEKVYIVNTVDVIKEYNPLEFVKNKLYLKLNYNFDKYIDIILKAINRFFDIDISAIGVEGSVLLGCYNENSDIDLLVFGKDNAKKIQQNFHAFNNYKGISLFDDIQAKKYVESRKECGYGKNEIIMQKQFLRRYYGYVLGKQFSIVCVPLETDNAYIDLNRNINYRDIFEGVLTIIEDDNSCVIPSVYYAVDSNKKQYKIEVYNHYGINQAKIGEKVNIRGKRYYKDQNQDEIIILSFWSNIKERFDLYE